ncbi:MAG: membrane protein insertase YidC [Labilithrix sp.]|nr:membrane protein insertase YidC [Labilithrix sp.]MCW5836125.1 membrane protein insertase YidC [Labilithrix sp.]
MDRNSLLRVLAIAAAVLLFWKFGLPLITGSSDKPQSVPEEVYANAPDFVPDTLDPQAEKDKPNKPVEGELCKIDGNRFDAVLSTRGAAIVNFHLEGGKYEGMDLSTTPDHERWRSLRTIFRGPDGKDQIKYDRVVWKLEPRAEGAAATSCTFAYEDEDVRLEKKVSAGERPFELNVATTVTNLAKEARKHQLSIGTYAFRKNVDMKGSLGRQSPWVTELACASGGDVVRKNRDEFKSGWFAVPSVDRYVAVNSQYFTQALMPDPADGAVKELPRCELLAEEWLAPGQAPDDDDAAVIFHAKLVYPGTELQPGASATYDEIAFFGPKERTVLAHAGGSDRLNDVINLGFFRPVARVLVGFLVFLHQKVTFGNWGVAIILLTVCLRTLLFPLTWKSIKTTIAMRKLKPEVDALNEKFKDDAQAKNLAMMELWKKHGVNPFGGCLPQLVQMPVWFAMYTTLQTAAEMYHVRFLWFKDLSAPDPYYILPLLLGAFMIVQQRIVPQQGMDPMQQKMMMWMMPIVFTVMMLFLPAALGVYMLTNSVLGIVQQLVLEQVAPRSKDGDKGGIVVKQKGEKPKGDGAKNQKALGDGFGKGKARV